MSVDTLKEKAAVYTVDHFVKPGMVVGLGVGSTALHAVRRLAHNLEAGTLHDIVCIPAAQRIQDEAIQLDIPLTTLDEQPRIDLTFDGADEVDPYLNLIKGGGGALLREKIVALASQQEIIMVDESKLVPVLGTKWALPVEVVPFGLGAHIEFLKGLGGDPHLRRKDSGEIYLTDGGHYILDTAFGEIHKPQALADKLNAQAGIVEHGLFLGLATRVVVANEHGVRTINPIR